MKKKTTVTGVKYYLNEYNNNLIYLNEKGFILESDGYGHDFEDSLLIWIRSKYIQMNLLI